MASSISKRYGDGYDSRKRRKEKRNLQFLLVESTDLIFYGNLYIHVLERRKTQQQQQPQCSFYIESKKKPNIDSLI